jgi:hypothetical protein
MRSPIRTYELLAMKQNLSLIKYYKKKNTLVESLNQCTELETQLAIILKTTFEKKENKTVSEIKSESWYNIKIQDELLAVKNRIEFLRTEIKNHNLQLAIEKEKHKKFIEKKDQYNKIALIERDEKSQLEYQIKGAVRS